MKFVPLFLPENIHFTVRITDDAITDRRNDNSVSGSKFSVPDTYHPSTEGCVHDPTTETYHAHSGYPDHVDQWTQHPYTDAIYSNDHQNGRSDQYSEWRCHVCPRAEDCGCEYGG